MSNTAVENIRNVTFIGHGASGKTTLADLLLFKSGAASRAGSPDDGSSLLDTDDEERERKSSLSSALIHFEHAGKRINLIDTPGYPDFIGHAVGAIRAVETAVIIINATSGIEVNTRRVFDRAGKAGIGRMICISRCDADNINFPELISNIQESFGAACVPINVPVGLGGSFSGVVSTLNVPDSVPGDVVVDPNEYNQTIMDAVVESDEELMMRYLEGEELSAEEVAGAVTGAIKEGTLIPIFCLSSRADAGVSEFLDGLADYALPANAIERTAKNPSGETVTLDQSADGPLVAQVFKTRIDPFVAKMSYIRVYSGSLKKGASVQATSASRGLKFNQLLEVQGGQSEDLDSASAGDIFAVVKMEDLHTNDTISDEEGWSIDAIPFPTPMIGLAVEPESRADQAKISGALGKISDEDATFNVYRDPQTKEMVMQGMSDLHLQLAIKTLEKRDKVKVVTKPPKIPYRETCMGTAEGSYRHKKQSGGSGQFAEVHFKIRPVPRDVNPEEYFTKDNFESMRSFNYDEKLNYAFVDRVTGGSVPNQFIPAVEKGIRERMEKGVIAGYQVQDVSCELFFGKDHPVDSNETAFKMAASVCFRDVFSKAKPVLLEPIVNAEIVIPADKMGDITSDLNGRRGRVEGMDALPGGLQVIHAKAPLAEMMTYHQSLSGMTGGEGSFTLEFSHYDVVPPNEQKKIIAASVKEEEES